jgi:broad specificity phosphatase PhoE
MVNSAPAMSLFAILLLCPPKLLMSFVLVPPSSWTSPNRPSFLSSTAKQAVGTQMETLVVSEMPAPLPANLKNKYYLLRHGQSTANVAGVISSARSLAYSDKHGLTLLGIEQGKESASLLLDLLKEESKPGDRVIFFSSPFARARQTAQACLDGLAEVDSSQRVEEMRLDISNDIVMEDRLMERFFGRLDDESIYTYAYVWPLDGFNVTHTAFDVESVAAVCTRLEGVVQRIESEYEGCHVVWTSHADVLQIAQLYGANCENVGIFSSYRFKNGEVRAMQRTPDSLPGPSPLEAPKRGTQM